MPFAYRGEEEEVNNYEVFDLGAVVLRKGATLRDAKLACKTYVTLNEEKSNSIIYSTGTRGSNPQPSPLGSPVISLLGFLRTQPRSRSNNR
jgi:homoserine acetyltransferase